MQKKLLTDQNQTRKEPVVEETLIEQYIHEKTWRVRENSNMAFSLQGMNNYIVESETKKFWLEKVYPDHIKESHEKGYLHIHDMGSLSNYCVGWDLQDFLTVGFTGVVGKVQSKPPKHFRSALGQLVNLMFTLQGETSGAQAVSSFDTLLAPFIYYDNIDYEQVKQEIQSFVFNMNIATRVGFQTPFSNVTIDLQPPSHYKNSPVIIGGEYKDKVYGDFQKEIDMFNQAFLEVMEEGDASGRVFTFPIPTYNITKDFDWDNPNINKLWEVTGKYGIPYFANFVNSDMDPDDVRSMCCRLRLDSKELRKRGGGLFGSAPLTGSIGVVTMNLPRVAREAKTESDFYFILSEFMEQARESLKIKRKYIEKLTVKNMYPYSRFYLRSVHQRFGEYWKNHFSTIGLVGMNEASLEMMGVDIGEEGGSKFSEEVLEFMREKMVAWQQEDGDMYNLEATPAEGTSYRLARIDKSYDQDAIVQGQFEPYYTNSSQLPVDYTDDMFELLYLQDELQIKYTGGTVQHLFLGEKVSDPEVVKTLVKRISNKFRLPYFSITPTFSVCQSCGYIEGEQFECPECGAETEVYSRVVGYLRPVKQWNDGKQEEFQDRKNLKYE